MATQSTFPASAPLSAQPPQPVVTPTQTDAAASPAQSSAPAAANTSIVTKAAQAAEAVGATLASGALGPQAAVVGNFAEMLAQLGTVVWKVFNPHVGTSSTHPTLAAAKAAAVANLQALHPGAVAGKATTAAVEITPVIHVTAADAAAAGISAGAGSTSG